MRKKNLLLACMFFVCGMQATAQDFENATTAVKNMGLGWNLGNTLEANSQTITDVTNDGYWGQQGLESETCWGQYVTKPELLKMMKDAGFGAIRVPVTWYNHMDKDGNVDVAWMKRVHEIVDYVINQGLYCIINVHNLKFLHLNSSIKRIKSKFCFASRVTLLHDGDVYKAKFSCKPETYWMYVDT